MRRNLSNLPAQSCLRAKIEGTALLEPVSVLRPAQCLLYVKFKQEVDRNWLVRASNKGYKEMEAVAGITPCGMQTYKNPRAFVMGVIDGTHQWVDGVKPVWYDIMVGDAQKAKEITASA